MPNATRQVRDFPECSKGEPDDDGSATPYATPAGLQTKDEISQDLRDHVFRAHKLPLRHAEAAVQKVKADTEKIQAKTVRTVANRSAPEPVQQRVAPPLPHQGHVQRDRRDRIPRPQVDEGIGQSDWNFFVSHYARYVKGTDLEGESVILHLWEACSEPLQRSLHHALAGTETNADRLLSLIKTLAVKKHNNLVSIIEMQRIGQKHDESIMAYSARANGKASLCDLFVECP